MGVMFGGGWPGRLASGMRGGGEGVAKEIEAELSEARESWPESHMLIEAHCNVTHSAAAPRRTSSPLDWLDLTGSAQRGCLGGTNSFPTHCSSPPHFLLTPLSPLHHVVPKGRATQEVPDRYPQSAGWASSLNSFPSPQFLFLSLSPRPLIIQRYLTQVVEGTWQAPSSCQ